MFDANDAIFMANAIFLLILGSIKFGNVAPVKLAAWLWTISIGACSYLILWSIQGHVTFRLFWITVPPYMFLIIVGILFVLLRQAGALREGRYFIAWILIGTLAIERPKLGMIYLIDGDKDILVRVFSQMLYTSIFVSCLLVPLVCLSESGKSIWQQWLPISAANIKKKSTPIIMCTILFYILFIFSNVLIEHKLYHIHLFSPLSVFVRNAVFKSLYIILISQFVSFGLTKKVLNLILPEEPSAKWIILPCACVYVMLNYYFRPNYIIVDFLNGLILAYLYIKTESLAYGMIIVSVLAFFTLYY
jgi:hypothetical protein